MTYTIGSLFAGIGGFDLGFERAGFKTAWQVEIDPYCTKVLAKNFPEAERFGDIRECGSHNLKPVDVICGGFPCQDISNAGLRAGITGERSGLWTEYARIIGELRPKYVLVENVAALLGRGMGVVLGDLATLGYDAEWDVVSARDVNAPHIRERIWIVAHSGCSRRREDAGGSHANEGEYAWRPAAQMHKSASHGQGSRAGNMADASKFAERESTNEADAIAIGGEAWLESGYRGRYVSNTNLIAKVRSSISRSECGDWAVEPNVGRVAHGVSKRVDRLRGLGNAVVPQIPEMIARRIKQALEAA